jgi:hypothetical protein
MLKKGGKIRGSNIRLLFFRSNIYVPTFTIISKTVPSFIPFFEKK